MFASTRPFEYRVACAIVALFVMAVGFMLGWRGQFEWGIETTLLATVRPVPPVQQLLRRL